MVKIGFICEGNTEQILLQSDSFKNLLTSLNLEPLPVIDAQGSGNLLPHNIKGYVERLEKLGADKIFILTDLDEDICITKTKQRISARPQDIVIIAVKKIESWFLACSTSIAALLRQPGFSFQEPEKRNHPLRYYQYLMVQHTGRGTGKGNGRKIKLITRLLAHGLDITQAASHPNCPSAQYFVSKLTEMGKGK